MFQLIGSRYYQGANIHAPVSVAVHEFLFTGVRRNSRPGLADVSVDLEKIAEKACPVAREQDALNLLGDLIVELLFLGTCRPGSGGLRRSSLFPRGPGETAVIHEYETEEQAAAAVALALRILGGGISTRRNRDDTLLRNIRSFIRRGAGASIKASTEQILCAAEARGIPWLWSNELGLFQLGHGRKRKWIDLTITQNTASLAVTIARDKDLTNELLGSHDLPVPRHIAVKTLADAVASADEIGFPLVVKPRRGHKGKGITVGVKNPAELKSAFQRAKRIDSTILIEQVLPGADHRLLIVNSRLIAAVRREPPQVTGNGRSTIDELVIAENRRRKKMAPGSALSLKLDSAAEQTLASQRLTRKSVPERGKRILLKTVANWSQGGTATDVTDAIHPDNRNAAIRAANAVGLDIAGVDFITPDISRPYGETGGGICEVNFRPGLLVHLAAMPRDLGGPVIDSLFQDDDGRIPIVVVLGGRNSGCADRVASRLSAGERNVAQLDGGTFIRYIDGTRSDEQLEWRVALPVTLQDPDIDAIVLALRSDDVIRIGCGLARSTATVLVHDPADRLERRAWEVVSGTAATSLVIREGEITEEAIACIVGSAFPASAQVASSGRIVRGGTFKNKGVGEPEEEGKALSIRRTARQYGLPVQSIIEWREIPLTQFGLGALQRRYRTAKTMRTADLSTRIADDKSATNRLLRMHSLPCPDQEIAGSKSAARRIAARMGFPVIVKPIDSSESRGVAGNIQNELELDQAVERAGKYSRQFVVERFHQGDDHRFLVIDGKVAHVTRHEPASVIGNGVDSVESLVEALNQDPLRGPDRTQPYVKIQLGPDQLRMLERAGLTPASIPENGAKVRLSSVSSLSTGGIAVDVTQFVHPDNIKLAERTARVIGLDICGLDVLSPDISRSHEDVETVIVEINQRPAYDSHDASSGWRNDIRERVLTHLYRGVTPYLPMIVCLEPGATELSRTALVLHHILLMTGGFVGLAAAGATHAILGPYRMRASEEERTLLNSVLNDPRVEKAMVVVPRIGRANEDMLRGATIVGESSGAVANLPRLATGHPALRFCDADVLSTASGAAIAAGVPAEDVAAALAGLYPEALRSPCLAQIMTLLGHIVIIGFAHADYPPQQLIALVNAAAQDRPRVLCYSGPAETLDIVLASADAHFDRCWVENQVPINGARTPVASFLETAPQPSIVLCLTSDPERTVRSFQARELRATPPRVLPAKTEPTTDPLTSS